MCVVCCAAAHCGAKATDEGVWQLPKRAYCQPCLLYFSPPAFPCMPFFSCSPLLAVVQVFCVFPGCVAAWVGCNSAQHHYTIMLHDAASLVALPERTSCAGSIPRATFPTLRLVQESGLSIPQGLIGLPLGLCGQNACTLKLLYKLPLEIYVFDD